MTTTANTIEAPPSYRLIARDIPLRHLRKSDGMSRPIRGDVAEINGRRIARFSTRARDGTVLHGCVELHADDYLDAEVPPGVDLDRVRGAIPTDLGDWIDCRLNEATSGWLPLAPRPEHEFARFAREWPVVASHLKLVAPAVPRRLFDPGRIARQKTIDAGLADLNTLLDRHACGDWGDHGFADPNPLTPVETWLSPSLSVELQNRAALAAKSGAIRSRYADAGIDILTWMGATTRTLITPI